MTVLTTNYSIISLQQSHHHRKPLEAGSYNKWSDAVFTFLLLWNHFLFLLSEWKWTPPLNTKQFIESHYWPNHPTHKEGIPIQIEDKIYLTLFSCTVNCIRVGEGCTWSHETDLRRQMELWKQYIGEKNE